MSENVQSHPNCLLVPVDETSSSQILWSFYNPLLLLLTLTFSIQRAQSKLLSYTSLPLPDIIDLTADHTCIWNLEYSLFLQM